MQPMNTYVISCFPAATLPDGGINGRIRSHWRRLGQCVERIDCVARIPWQIINNGIKSVVVVIAISACLLRTIDQRKQNDGREIKSGYNRRALHVA